MSISNRTARVIAVAAAAGGLLSLTAAAFAASGASNAPERVAVKGSLGLGAVRTAPPFSLTASEKFSVCEQLPGRRVAAMTLVRERAMTVVPAAKPAPKRTVTVASRKAAAPRKPAPKPAPVAAGEWRTSRVTWYGPGFYGNTMAGGGVLTPSSMVVAHRTMKFGTKIQFSYRGKTTVAVVQDRGPYNYSYEFDLGPGTAQALGFSGSGNVQWRIVK
ncbi:MAG: hypothetical protein FDZ70_03260 [Actinobacteria bacterium]|nr:MAG: hypothetical protein FDZ70_03260 [Actinomycetota bacterium]